MKTKTDWLNIKAWVFSGLASALLSLFITTILINVSKNDSIWVGVLLFKFILIFLTIQMQPHMKNSLELMNGVEK